MNVTYWERINGREVQVSPETAAGRRNKGIGTDGRCFLFSPEEEAARDAEEAAWAADAPNRQKLRVIAKLEHLDPRSVRHVDDIIGLLVSKGVFTLAELPPAVQVRYAERQTLRDGLK